MKTFLYLLPAEHEQAIKDALTLVSAPPEETYSAPLQVDSALIQLVLLAERVETNQGLDARKLIIPADKICVGIMVEGHVSEDSVRRTECDMFADHEVAPNTMVALAERMTHIGGKLVERKFRPRNTVSYAWTYDSQPGYKVLRLCGRFS